MEHKIPIDFLKFNSNLVKFGELTKNLKRFILINLRMLKNCHKILINRIQIEIYLF